MFGFSIYHWIVIVVIAIGLVALYLVPTLIVVMNRHARRAPIIVLNVIAGWTVVGWIVALIWALMPPGRTDTAPPRGIPVDLSDDRPGKFKVSGVDRESGLDAVLYIDAESASNAKVKAELRDLIVTHVESAADEIAQAKTEAEQRRQVEQGRLEAQRRKQAERDEATREQAERERQDRIQADRRSGLVHCPQCDRRMKITGWESAVKCPYCGKRVDVKLDP